MLTSGGIQGWCVCMNVEGTGMAEYLQVGCGGLVRVKKVPGLFFSPSMPLMLEELLEGNVLKFDSTHGEPSNPDFSRIFMMKPRNNLCCLCCFPLQDWACPSSLPSHLGVYDGQLQKNNLPLEKLSKALVKIACQFTTVWPDLPRYCRCLTEWSANIVFATIMDSDKCNHSPGLCYYYFLFIYLNQSVFGDFVTSLLEITRGKRAQLWVKK